jgi:hypothetical protein
MEGVRGSSPLSSTERRGPVRSGPAFVLVGRVSAE